ncbi:MAG: galactokinase [Anaerolineales bacterium]|jgi:galactokinase|nr:galactokinase [Anaerolineales bacterium]
MITGTSLNLRFSQLFDCAPRLYGHAPGRVNLLGEHVDYNQGVVLPAAIDRQVSLAAAPARGRIVTLYALDMDQLVSFNLDHLDRRQDVDGLPLPSWALYPAGVAWALQEAGLAVQGMQAVFTSDVPIGAGLSSSAAVEVAFAVTWRLLGAWKVSGLALAQLCQRAENAYVGVSSGLMDQFASACGVRSHLLYFDTRSLEHRPLPLPSSTSIVIADSGVRRTLATSAYNDRRSACEEAVRLLQKYKPGMQSLRDITSVELAAYALELPEIPRKRAEHVTKEMLRVEQAVSALEHQDARQLGALMYATHRSLRDLYEVSCPELDLLVQLTRQIPGCYGARLTGAGFGGCTVNLVETTAVETFSQVLHDKYLQHTGRDVPIYVCHAADGASARKI